MQAGDRAGMRSGFVLAVLVTTFGCATTPPKPSGPAPTVLRVGEVRWEQLNPARGDKSPRAADLSGDRKASGPTGFLVKFVDGFSSPPHIHNVTYRGVVISGEVHNDDPDAEALWMPVGSFWTQPKGDVHITSAKGSEVVAYIEIDDGPYLVRPPDQAFATDETPRNLTVDRLPWTGGPRASADGPRLAPLWGDPQGDGAGALMVEVAPGAKVRLQGQGTLQAVVVAGEVDHAGAALSPGSYLDARRSEPVLGCSAAGACLLYVREVGAMRVTAAP